MGRGSGAAYIAAEYVEGRTLRQLMQVGRVPLAETVRIAAQSAAFGVPHEAGIIHRDIKPENIMVRPDGLVKVLEFGLARTDSGTAEFTQGGRAETGAVMGTPRYMSPERARGVPLDPRSDIFSLAAFADELHQAASRRRPAPALALRRWFRPLQRNWKAVAALAALVIVGAAWLVDRNTTPNALETANATTVAKSQN